MPSDSGKRVVAFVRSVLPAEPAHFLLLLGATFLFIAHGLRWSPFREPGVQYLLWASDVSLMTLLIVVSGVAAGYVCLVPTKRPLRRLVFAVLLPALVALVAIPLVGFVWFSDVLDFGGDTIHSIIEQPDPHRRAIPMLLANLGPGLQIATAGFVLVGIFAVLLYRGRATLPIRLRFSFPFSTADTPPEDDRRTAIFIWMMVCLIILSNILGGAIGFGLYRLVPRFEFSRVFRFSADQVVAALSLFLLLVLALGKDRKAALRLALRLPSFNYVVIGALIPLAVASVWPLASYFLAMNHWAAYEYGSYGSPSLRDFFSVPSAASLWLLLPAFVEEIAWRGYLQPRFVQKYGIVRGIFLVGIVWGAFHFAGDFRYSMTTLRVLTHIARRLIETVAQSYVLGWLAIRSRSILPGTACHAAFNVTVLWGISPVSIRMPFWIEVAAWGTLGYILFRYFPVSAMDEDAPSDATPDYEAAL